MTEYTDNLIASIRAAQAHLVTDGHQEAADRLHAVSAALGAVQPVTPDRDAPAGLTDEQIGEFWNWDISERWVREKVASRIREAGYIVVRQGEWEHLRQTRVLDVAMIRAAEREKESNPDQAMLRDQVMAWWERYTENINIIPDMAELYAILTEGIKR